MRFFCLSLLILATCAMMGCSRVARLLDLESNSVPLRRASLTQPEVKTTATVKCCWCVLKTTGRNDVRPFLGRESCEARSSQPPFGPCRAVEVEGTACALVRVTRPGGKLQCRPNPLTYMEGGRRQAIAAPDDYDLTCRSGVLMRSLQIEEQRGISAAIAPDSGITDEYCACGRDPENEANCRVVKVSGGLAQPLASRPRGPGQTSCTHDVCYSLFDEKEYRPKCPQYVQGDP